MQAGKIRGLVVIPVDFAEQMERANATAPIQVITDGSEPNTANFVQGYVEGIWQIWQMQRAEDNGQTFEPLIDVQTRYWFNPAAISQHFIIPGAVTGCVSAYPTITSRRWRGCCVCRCRCLFSACRIAGRC